MDAYGIPARTERRFMTRGNMVGLLLAAAILTLAGVLLVKQFGSHRLQAIPTSVDAPTFWYCHKCQQGFALSPREAAQTMSQERLTAPNGQPDRHGRTVIAVKCPSCGGKAVSAYRCLTDGTIFDARSPEGHSRGCPKCGWNPLSK